jgi:hypothetical protein
MLIDDIWVDYFKKLGAALVILNPVLRSIIHDYDTANICDATRGLALSCLPYNSPSDPSRSTNRDASDPI